MKTEGADLELADVKLSYDALIWNEHAQLIIAHLLLRRSSELLFLESVGEHVELGNVVTRALRVLNGFAEGNGALHVVALTAEDLELIPFTSDGLNQFSGTLLEAINAVILAILLEFLEGLLHHGLGPGHEVLLGPLNLIEVEGIDDVINGFSVIIIFENIIGGNGNLVGALLDEGTADLKTGILHAVRNRVGVGDEFITGEKAFVHSHS